VGDAALKSDLGRAGVLGKLGEDLGDDIVPHLDLVLVREARIQVLVALDHRHRDAVDRLELHPGQGRRGAALLLDGVDPAFSSIGLEDEAQRLFVSVLVFVVDGVGLDILPEFKEVLPT